MGSEVVSLPTTIVSTEDAEKVDQPGSVADCREVEPGKRGWSQGILYTHHMPSQPRVSLCDFFGDGLRSG